MNPTGRRPPGTFRFNFFAFDPAARGGVRVATGDGVDDIIAASGPGLPTGIRVFDGATGNRIMSFRPFESSFTGGAYVCVGPVEGPGRNDIVVSAAETGGPQVVVIRPPDGATLANFFAFGDTSFRCGARVTVQDVNKDGAADVVARPAPAAGPGFRPTTARPSAPGSRRGC